MKTEFLKLLTFVAIVFIFSFCSKSSYDRNNSGSTDISNVTGSWVCNPEPNVTITLTFDSGKVFVNTFPQDIYIYMTTNGNRVYLFSNDDQYIVRKNTLYFVNPIFNNRIESFGFVGTMLSPNRMNLQSFGRISFPDNGIYITEYIFERKTH